MAKDSEICSAVTPAEVRKAIDGLRHRHVLVEENIEKWIREMMAREPERILWHVRRLDGANASSSYGYVSDYRQVFDAFHCARELDLLRQMMITPERANADMIRGTMLEGVVQIMSHETFGARTAREAMDAVTAQRGVPACPALIGNPDDVVEVSTRSGLELWDYKCPAKEKNELDRNLLMEYVTQAHQYVMLGAAAKQPIKRMKLINLNCPPELAADLAQDLQRIEREGNDVLRAKQEEFAEMLLRLAGKAGSGRSITLVPQVIAFDRDLVIDLIRAANLADERALKGELAPWPQRPVAELPPEKLAQGVEMEKRATMALLLAEQMEQYVSHYKGSYQQLVRGTDLKGRKSPFTTLTVGERNNFQADRALAYLESRQADTSDLREPGDFDPEKVQALAARARVNVDSLRMPGKPVSSAVKARLLKLEPEAVGRFCVKSYSMGLVRSSKGPGAEALAAMRELVRDLSEDLLMRDSRVTSISGDASPPTLPAAAEESPVPDAPTDAKSAPKRKTADSRPGEQLTLVSPSM